MEIYKGGLFKNVSQRTFEKEYKSMGFKEYIAPVKVVEETVKVKPKTVSKPKTVAKPKVTQTIKKEAIK